MKLKQQVFCLISAISKYMAIAQENVAMLADRIVHSAEVSYSVNNCHEKLQIRYANIRV